MTLRRIVIQLVGYGAGIALLVWCVSRALSPENRAQLARLADASVWQVLFLCALSVASIVLNGLIFWTAVRPARSVPLPGVLATNAIATALNYVPFKLSMISRVVIHRRRDGLPYLTIVGWLGAVIVILGATLGPMVAISIKHPVIDATWLALVGGALLLVAACVVLGARLMLSARVHGFLRRAPLKLVRRLFAMPAESPLFDGVRMLASPRAVGAGVALRLADVTAQSARFVLAAGILGVALPFDRAFLLAATYFGIGIVSPFGMLGTREAGVAGLADALQIPNPDAIAAVVLLVSATEALVTLIMATIGVIYLRPMKLRLKAIVDAAASEAASPSAAPIDLPSVHASGPRPAEPDRR